MLAAAPNESDLRRDNGFVNHLLTELFFHFKSSEQLIQCNTVALGIWLFQINGCTHTVEELLALIIREVTSSVKPSGMRGYNCHLRRASFEWVFEPLA